MAAASRLNSTLIERVLRRLMPPISYRSATDLTLPPYVERPARQELFQSISHIGTVRSYVRPLRAAQYGPLASMRSAERGAKSSLRA